MNQRFSLLFLSLALCLNACEAVPWATGGATPILTVLPSPSWTPALSPTPTLTGTPRPTLTPYVTPTDTPGPYDRYTIPYLRARAYGGGQIELTTRMDKNPSFERYAFKYPSDGLNIYGFMDVPAGDGPYPVIIALHGKTPTAGYATLDYSTPYADQLAETGYLVLHPNLRGYPPSDNGDNLYRDGMAIDVLNLIALIKSEGGQAGPLAKADPQRIGLWGHSMGGGIALKVITISPDVKAALLYAPLSGDEQLNFKTFFSGPDNPQAALESQTNPIAWFHISAQFYLQDITAAVSIHQGLQDTTVPPAWSAATCQRLKDLGKTVFCVNYPDMGHSFSGMTDKKFIILADIFFKNYLKGPAP